MKVALFLPCFNDALFPGTGVATVRILERLGVEVDYPTDQTCCGQVHFNTGYRREARRLMKRFLKVFGDAETIVAPSASCVAMVREQYPELAPTGGGGPRTAIPGGGSAGEDGGAGSDPLIREIDALTKRIFELSEFLVGRLGIEDVGASFPHPVALHPTCHSIRGIDVGDAPLRLLRGVRDLELVELPGAAECCGFGGTFAVKNPDTSLAMLHDKMESIQASGARVLTAVDNSCLMHIAGGLRRAGRLDEGPGTGGIRVMHLAEILTCEEGG